MIYTIKQGKHYSTHWLGMVWRFLTGWQLKSHIVIKGSFDEKCLIPSKDGDDLNKLPGLALGFDHHQDSARVGWRAEGNMIGLYTYVYSNGKREKEKLIARVYPNEEFKVSVSYGSPLWRIARVGYRFFRAHTALHPITGKQMTAFIGGDFITVETDLAEKPLLYKKLYPYFGGTYPAPVDMKIKIEWL